MRQASVPSSSVQFSSENKLLLEWSSNQNGNNHSNKKLFGPWTRSEGTDTRENTNLQQLGGYDCGYGRQDQPLWIHILPYSSSECYTIAANAAISNT